MAERELRMKKKSRGGHKFFVKKSLAEAKECLENPLAEVKSRLEHLKLALEEQLPLVKLLDEEILKLQQEIEEITDEEIGEEIEEAANLRTEIKTTLKKIDTFITPVVQVTEQTPSTSQQTAQPHHKNLKLPKLEIRKFSGKPEDWQEFSDVFESSINSNPGLTNVDKFSYLRGLLQDPAKAAISGFALTSANYESAYQLLKDRFGKKTLIQKKHIDELLRISAVFNDKDTHKIRKLYDSVETNHRGLQALGVDECLYSAIVVPSIIKKLPETFRLTITRGKKHTEWTMNEMLKELRNELELREEHSSESETKESRRDADQEVKRNQSKGLSTASALLTETLNNCAFCKGNHAHKDCSNVTTISERKQLIRKYGRCFVCMKKGHLAKNCLSKNSCNLCKGKHHVSICEKEHVVSTSNPDNNSRTSPMLHVGTRGRIALQTAQAIIKGEHSKKVRVLFDSGSHRSFITTRAVKSIGVKFKRKEWVEISTFGQKVNDKGLRQVFELELYPVNGGEGSKIEVFEVPSISQIRNEHVEERKREYPHLHGLWFSDICKDRESLDIDILIGADYLWSFQGGRTIRGELDEPVAVETRLGWVLSGPMKGSTSDSDVSVNFVRQEEVRSHTELDGNINKLWDFETLGIRQEDSVHEALKDAITFNGERYQVSLPWKEGHGVLPTNYHNSLSRLKGQLRKLRKEPEVCQEYSNIIKDQLKKGIIEQVVDLEQANRVHYLPHHAVVRKQVKTTKVRVVFDASSKEGKKGVALNDCLHVGPALTPLLYDILLRFRMNRIALVADIEKAFLNVEVSKKDRDCLRFLWVDDINSDLIVPLVYRFCRVVFGVNCSPFLLNATLHHHLETHRQVDPEFVDKLKDSFYVDDLATGDNTEKEAFELYSKASTRLASGGFRLRKWMSNSQELMSKINETEDEREIEETYAGVTLGADERGDLDKVLGIPWDLRADEFCFSLGDVAKRAKHLVPTKRNILSILAGLYDPLGIVSPVGICMRMLFQELCIAGLNWDEELTGKKRERWLEWVKDLEKVEQIRVPRYVLSKRDENLQFTLHGFADASNKAYCAVLYLVCQSSEGIHVELLTSKTRVAPLKAHTIPRMELMAGRILAKLVNTVMSALKREIEISEPYLWLDSMTALYWIDNKGEWKQFVRQRVNEILQMTKKENWGHCPGEENPADIGSRGLLASKLKIDRLWWKGPEWLSGPREGWPVRQKVEETVEGTEEIKKTVVMNAVITEIPSICSIINISKFSELGRLLRVTALVRRFVSNLKAKRRQEDTMTGMLNKKEISAAERLWIEAAQLEFRDRDRLQILKYEFDLVEIDGIFRCNGRLNNSDLNEEARQPVLLPKDHRLTELVIVSCHKKVHHCGLRITLAELRSQFWVPRGRQVVKKVISKCLVCIRLQGKSYCVPPRAALPDFRVKQSPPFSKVGVDFAGPLYARMRKGEDMEKVYIVLFTCCVTRAVHLELIENLSAGVFICCLRRFAARRGSPTKIVSDNAKTFKYTSKYLKRLYKSLDVKEYLEVNQIEWEFNLEKAPWWGGFFERLIGTVKRCLKKVLGKSKLSFDELNTVLLEVESTVNSRPLTYVYEELESEPLTPLHLIYGRRLSHLPDEEKDDEDVTEGGLVRRYRHLARLRKHFWNRWRREYLADLREFHKWNGLINGDSKARVGDVVLVHEDGVKRGLWKLGKIEELIVGKDKCARGAKVRVLTKGKPVYLNRPVQKLHPLEIRSCQEDIHDDVCEPEPTINEKLEEIPIVTEQKKQENVRRSKRIAARHAIPSD